MTLRYPKRLLWLLMALCSLSVLFYSEIPLLHQPEERAHIHDLRWLLIPHAIAGTIALLLGPFQFATRLRTHRRALHRILGRVYVAAVFLAAPLALLATAYSHYPKAIYFRTAIAIQATAWAGTTVIALFSAVRHQFVAHRVWMIRSYAVTFTFVATRVLQPIPAWNHIGRFWFAAAIVIFTCLAVLTPNLSRAFAVHTPTRQPHTPS
jgi:hypothetical protein